MSEDQVSETTEQPAPPLVDGENKPLSPADQAEAQPQTDAVPSAENQAVLNEDAPQGTVTRKKFGEGGQGDEPGNERQPGEGTSPKEEAASPEPSSPEQPSADVAPQATDPVDPSPTSVQPEPQGPVNSNPPPNYPDCYIQVKFQERPIGEVGVNGCQLEDVLNLCFKRLEGFQRGPVKCLENDKALAYIQNAVKWLERRTSLRKMQNVEGTNMPHNSTT